MPEVLAVAMSVCGRYFCGQDPCFFGKSRAPGFCCALGGQGDGPRLRMYPARRGLAKAADYRREEQPHRGQRD